MQADTPKGCFVAVVGPSGAGKDTIMDAARVALSGDMRFHFVRRIITRTQMPGTEDHDSLMKRILPGRQVRGVLHFTGRRMACVMACRRRWMMKLQAAQL